MKFLISRGNFDRLTEGMEPWQVRAAERLFEVGDSEPLVPLRIDNERVGDTFDRLLADRYGIAETARPVRGARRLNLGRVPLFAVQAGKSTALRRAATTERGVGLLPRPWEEAGYIGDGTVWTAPIGTPPPPLAKAHGNPKTALTTEEIQAVQAYLREWTRRYAEGPRPRRYRLHAGDHAIAALHQTPRQGAETGEPALSGMPVVRDQALPANEWRLVDVDTGKVIKQGTVGPTVDEYLQVCAEAVRELAERTGVPASLLWDRGA